MSSQDRLSGQLGLWARRTLPVAVVAASLLLTLLALLRQQGLALAAVTPPYTPDFTATGPTPGSNFGFAVARGGDINGDTYGDVVVGAYIARQVFVYSGSASGLNSTAFFTASSTQVSDQFGYSVAGGGDFDGDGVDDFAVGAPVGDVNTSTLQVGLVYLYYGTSGGQPSQAPEPLAGEESGSRFGDSVSVAGDVNNDGYDDLVVGAWQYGEDDRGRVYLYLGSSEGIQSTPALTLTGETSLDNFGYSVDGAGDVNADGYDDVVVGAWKYNSGAGKVYIYLGGPDGLNVDDVVTVVGAPESELGVSVAGAGDVNGDGYDDVLVGAYRDSSAGEHAGKALLFLGSPIGVDGPHWTQLGKQAGDEYGFAVAGAGDLNGDGFDDLAVGAYLSDEPANASGAAYAYGGCVGGVLPEAIFAANGEYQNDRYGHALAGIGDVNGDQIDDLAVGAYSGKKLLGDSPVPHGKLFVYYGVKGGGCVAQVQVTKTVGLAGYPPLCGTATEIHAPEGASLTYCYTVKNTGNVTLTHHFVADSGASEPLPIRTPMDLAPGASYSYVITHTPSAGAVHSITWTSVISVTGPGGAAGPEARYLSAVGTATANVIISSPADDQDGDGVPDNQEGVVDNDRDGIPAYLDPDERPGQKAGPVYLPLLP